MKDGKMSKEENCEYNKTQKFKDIKTERIKLRKY